MSTPSKATKASTAQRAYVLDDEAEIRKIVCTALAQNGYEAQPFSTLLPFLVAVKARPPALVVLDLALGQSDAIEVIRHLEILAYRGNVLLMTGRDEATLAQVHQIGRSRGLAMLPPLTKPFRIHDLVSRLAADPETNAPATKVAPAGPIIDLREALQERWLQLWYQPKICLKTLQVVGAEALLRAQHPDQGIILPNRLLPNVGDSLHHALAQFVIRQSCADWSRLAASGTVLTFSVNIPVSIVHAPSFLTIVRAMIPSDARFPGLIVEITEDEVIRDAEMVREAAAQLKIYNVSLSIDDFGSAYSSLSRLRDLPCTELKLDRSFVSGCDTDPLKAAVCQMVVALGHRFGVDVCAEGVETEAELRTLVELGFDTAQGFFFSKAVPLPQLIEKLHAKACGASNMPPPSATPESH
jgi:EAL domain-containing protein (putative c-di-GMP-specific phosphodiesterase class I)/ActR/RegA family two-component response regulator